MSYRSPAMSRWTLVVASLVVGSLAPRVADAGMIVLESYVGEKPKGVGALVAPLLDEARRRGFVVAAPLAERVRAQISLPARSLTATELAAARRLIDSGVGRYRDGQYKPAIDDLSGGIALLMAAPVTLASDSSSRDLLFQALIYLAQSNSRMGRTVEATRAMAELMRSFPDREISHAEHGPEPRNLYRKVKADLDSQGRGRLDITLDDAKTVVFINERYAGVGDTSVSDLFPGRYRVFVQQGDRPGRVHEVDVEAGIRATLNLAWGVDSTLRTGDGYVGLVFDSEDQRGKLEAVYAIRVARALDATGVAVVSVREFEGRRSLVGTLYSLDSTKPVRTAALALEPVGPSDDKVRAMGRFLAGDEDAAKLFANLAAAGAADAPNSGGGDDKAGDPRRPYRTWKWVGVLGGVAALGAGATLVAIHAPEFNDDGSRNDTVRNTRTAGIATAAAGGVLTLAGVYLWIRDGKDARKRSVAVLPTAGGAFLAVAGTF